MLDKQAAIERAKQLLDDIDFDRPKCKAHFGRVELAELLSVIYDEPITVKELQGPSWLEKKQADREWEERAEVGQKARIFYAQGKVNG